MNAVLVMSEVHVHGMRNRYQHRPAVTSYRLALHDHLPALSKRRPDMVRHEARRVFRVVRAPVPVDGSTQCHE